MDNNVLKTSKIRIPIQLAEEIYKGNVVLWWGWQKQEQECLVQMLAQRCEYVGTDDLATVAGYFEYEAQKGRHALINSLKNYWVPSADTSLLSQLLALPIRQIISPRLDNYVENALKKTQKPFTTIVTDSEVPYLDRAKPFLIKPYGSLDRPESLVLTKKDYHTYFRTHPRIVELMRTLLAAQTWLLVNEIQEDLFERVFYESSYDVGRHQRQHFVLNCVVDNPKTWRTQGIEFLSSPLDLFITSIAAQIARISPSRLTTGVNIDTSSYKRPYKFLDYFTSQDRALFFGREKEIQSLTEQIISSRLTVLFGRSGVGKTSLLMAGVIPELEATNYRCLYVRFGQDPEWTIKQGLLRLWDSMASDPPDSDLPLAKYVFEAANRLHSMLVIFIDQFEEFETQLSPLARGAFAKAMGELLRIEPSSVKLVLSIREDFLGVVDGLRPEVFEPLAYTYRLTNLTREGAREAIEQPVRNHGLRFEGDAVQYLLDSLVEKSTIQGGIFPPHLQIVCYRIFESLPSYEGHISLSFVKEFGEVDKLLDQYLQASIQTLRPENRELARSLLKQLVTAAGTKASKRQDEFIANDDITDFLNFFIERRLVRRNSENGQVYYELAHDQLAEAIKSWINIQEKQAKDVFEMLTHEVNYRLYSQSKGEQYAGVGLSKLCRVYEQRENPHLKLTSKMQEMLLYSALLHSQMPKRDVPNHPLLDFWINQVKDGQEVVRIIDEFVTESDPYSQPLSGLNGRAEHLREDVREALVEHFKLLLDDTDKLNRLKAAQALWCLRQTLSIPELWRVSWTILTLRLVPQGARKTPKLAGTLGLLLVVVVSLAGSFLVASRYACGQGMLAVDSELCQFIMPFETIEPLPHEWVNIPEGDFIFGASEERTTATLDTFSIDKHEVTNAQYQRCVDADICRAPVNSVFDLEEYRQHPVTNITLDEARTYCSWIGGNLPSELQWEKAARGTEGFEYPWGDESIQDGLANICDAQCPESLRVESLDDGFAQTAPVGSFPAGASPFGVEDMVGNVWEWTSDAITKGGSWRNDKRLNKATSRTELSPDSRDASLGFRCIRSE